MATHLERVSGNLTVAAEIHPINHVVEKTPESGCTPNHNPHEIVELLNVPEYEILRLDFSTNSVKSKKVVLAEWALKNNINHVALSELLKKLQIWLPHDGFPSDSRTLLRSPRQVLTSFIPGGEFYHFGIRGYIIETIKEGLHHFNLPVYNNFIGTENLITLKIGIDGLPISKIPNLQFWPILCSIDQSSYSKVFIVSLFYGETKPQCIKAYLEPFISEMKDLESLGIEYDGTRYSVRIRCLIADAPARSFVKCIKITMLTLVVSDATQKGSEQIE
jgi:hypothetical protein